MRAFCCKKITTALENSKEITVKLSNDNNFMYTDNENINYQSSS